MRLQVEGAGPDPLRRALLGLDELARERKVRVVLILDEFQKLRQLSDHEALEANIRHAAERATACTYVFSGSHRHLLEQQFEDPQAPLYRLCEPLDLERIGEADYRAHLEAHARRRWRRKPPAALIERILVLTERHPYYVNYLCGSLWQSRSIPDEAEVVAEWARLVRAQQTQFAAQLEPLSPNQVAFLHALARNPTEQVQSQEFLAQAGLASSSAAKVRRDLARSDLIGSWPDGRLHVLDPGMRPLSALGTRPADSRRRVSATGRTKRSQGQDARHCPEPTSTCALLIVALTRYRLANSSTSALQIHELWVSPKNSMPAAMLSGVPTKAQIE